MAAFAYNGAVVVESDDMLVALIREVTLARLLLNESFELSIADGERHRAYFMSSGVPLQFVYDTTKLGDDFAHVREVLLEQVRETGVFHIDGN